MIKWILCVVLLCGCSEVKAKQNEWTIDRKWIKKHYNKPIKFYYGKDGNLTYDYVKIQNCKDSTKKPKPTVKKKAVYKSNW